MAKINALRNLNQGVSRGVRRVSPKVSAMALPTKPSSNKMRTAGKIGLVLAGGYAGGKALEGLKSIKDARDLEQAKSHMNQIKSREQSDRERESFMLEQHGEILRLQEENYNLKQQLKSKNSEVKKRMAKRYY